MLRNIWNKISGKDKSPETATATPEDQALIETARETTGVVASITSYVRRALTNFDPFKTTEQRDLEREWKMRAREDRLEGVKKVVGGVVDAVRSAIDSVMPKHIRNKAIAGATALTIGATAVATAPGCETEENAGEVTHEADKDSDSTKEDDTYTQQYKDPAKAGEEAAANMNDVIDKAAEERAEEAEEAEVQNLDKMNETELYFYFLDKINAGEIDLPETVTYDVKDDRGLVHLFKDMLNPMIENLKADNSNSARVQNLKELNKEEAQKAYTQAALCMYGMPGWELGKILFEENNSDKFKNHHLVLGKDGKAELSTDGHEEVLASALAIMLMQGAPKPTPRVYVNAQPDKAPVVAKGTKTDKTKPKVKEPEVAAKDKKDTNVRGFEAPKVPTPLLVPEEDDEAPKKEARVYPITHDQLAAIERSQDNNSPIHFSDDVHIDGYTYDADDKREFVTVRSDDGERIVRYVPLPNPADITAMRSVNPTLANRAEEVYYTYSQALELARADDEMKDEDGNSLGIELDITTREHQGLKAIEANGANGLYNFYTGEGSSNNDKGNNPSDDNLPPVSKIEADTPERLMRDVDSGKIDLKEYHKRMKKLTRQIVDVETGEIVTVKGVNGATVDLSAGKKSNVKATGDLQAIPVDQGEANNAEAGIEREKGAAEGSLFEEAVRATGGPTDPDPEVVERLKRKTQKPTDSTQQK